MPRYLYCPQCGAQRFFVNPSGGATPVYFYVDADRHPQPTETSHADLNGCDFSLVACCGCSWMGGLHKLVARFPAS